MKKYKLIILALLTGNHLTFMLNAQKSSGHISYGFISLDTTNVNTESMLEAEYVLITMKDDLKAEVFYNKEWFVVLRKERDADVKRMFNRKTKILYTYREYPDKRFITVDSFQLLKSSNPDLLPAISTIREGTGISDIPKERRKIHGYSCSKLSLPAFLGEDSLAMDIVWLADFKGVPDLIFPENFYFLIDGIPMACEQHFGEAIIYWGPVSFGPVDKDDPVFTQPTETYEPSDWNTEKIIFELADFLKVQENK